MNVFGLLVNGLFSNVSGSEMVDFGERLSVSDREGVDGFCQSKHGRAKVYR